MTKMRGDRRGGRLPRFGVALAFVILVPAHAVATALSNVPAVAVGQRDMTLGDTNRICRMTSESRTRVGQRVDIPAGCRRALPIFAEVGAWTAPPAGRIDLADASGKMVLDFNAKSGASLGASGPDAETYRLVQVGAAAGTFDREDVDVAQGFKTVQASPPPAKPAASTTTPKPAAPAAAPKAAAAQPPKPSAAALALKPGDVAGRYSIEREGDKDTGCMLIFEDVAKGQRGNKAVLAPGCRDQGIIIFDPAGWRLADGRLVLIARRGYSTHLDLQANGSWLKDPKEGKPLILKKM